PCDRCGHRFSGRGGRKMLYMPTMKQPFLLLGAVALLASLTACDPDRPPRFTSYSNLHAVGLALRNYTNDHGQLPQRLSDLVPDYIPQDRMDTFYIANKYVQRRSKPSDWASNRFQIDRLSSYRYIGTNSPNEIIAFEKPGLWKPSAPLPEQLAVLYKDFHVQY